jgi:glycosyltransferase involved in cell wall biosynthesis
MRIGIVTTWYPVGAGYVSKAYRNTLEKEHEVYIYARAGSNMKNDPVWDDIQVTWAPKHYAITGIWTNHFKKWIRNNQIDTIIFNEQRHWFPILKAKELGVCVGAYVDYYTQNSVSAFAIYDFLICNTKRHYSVFDWHPKCFYIPWGTDINYFSPKEDIDNHPLRFLASAGWSGSGHFDRRGTLLAMKSFINLIGVCQLFIFSQVPLERCTDEFQNLVRSDKRIDFRFGTFEPFPFNAGDVYLYPSRLDGIGLSLPEAISSGLAAITTDCAPMNEFVKDDFNGYLVKVNRYLGRHDGYYWAESICDLDSLTEKMQKYVDDPHMLKEHKRNSRRYAENHLDWELNSKQLLKFINGKEFTSQVPTNDLLKKIKKLDKKNNQSIYNQWVRLIILTIKELVSFVKPSSSYKY